MSKTLSSPLCSQNVLFLVKIEGVSVKTKKKVPFLKTKFECSVLGLRKHNFRTKIFTLKILTLPKIVKKRGIL